MTLYVDLVTAGHVTAALNFRINSLAPMNNLPPHSFRVHLWIKCSETDGEESWFFSSHICALLFPFGFCLFALRFKFIIVDSVDLFRVLWIISDEDIDKNWIILFFFLLFFHFLYSYFPDNFIFFLNLQRIEKNKRYSYFWRSKWKVE